MSFGFMFLGALALAGLVVILFAGRQRHTASGTIDAPAPRSPESPLTGEPKVPPKNRG